MTDIIIIRIFPFLLSYDTFISTYCIPVFITSHWITVGHCSPSRCAFFSLRILLFYNIRMSFVLFGHYIFILFYFLSLSLTLQHFLYSLYYSSVTLIPLLRLRLHFYSKLTFTSLQLSLDILFQADFFFLYAYALLEVDFCLKLHKHHLFVLSYPTWKDSSSAAIKTVFRCYFFRLW